MVEAISSIIIPTWNCASYVYSCLDSILTQSYQNIEVIVIHDASTDDTVILLRHYLTKDSMIVLNTNSYNQGIGICRNIGLSKACGKYFLFVDTDNFLSEATLAAIAQNLKNEEIDFSSCIQVIKTRKGEIESEFYCGYNKNMLRLAIKWEARPEIIEYYREKMLTYIEYMSFEKFLFRLTSLDKKQLKNMKEKYVERIRKVEIV